MRSAAALLLASLTLFAPCASAALPADAENLLVGGWLCVSNCMDEEYGFALEDGTRRFATWTHHRPSIIQHEWKLEGSRLVVTASGEPRYDYRIMQITGKRLVMREAQSAGGKVVVLKRIVDKPKP